MLHVNFISIKNGKLLLKYIFPTILYLLALASVGYPNEKKIKQVNNSSVSGIIFTKFKLDIESKGEGCGKGRCLMGRDLLSSLSCHCFTQMLNYSFSWF